MSWHKIRKTLVNTIILEEYTLTNERWLGSTGGVAPGSESSLTPFRVTSAAVANTFGAVITVLDGTETPLETDKKAFGFHRMQIIDVEFSAKTYRLRFASDMNGLYADFASAVAAGFYSDIVFKVDKSNSPGLPLTLKTGRANSGSKVWAALATLDALAQYVDFVVGIHEYDEIRQYDL